MITACNKKAPFGIKKNPAVVAKSTTAHNQTGSDAGSVYCSSELHFGQRTKVYPTSASAFSLQVLALNMPWRSSRSYSKSYPSLSLGSLCIPVPSQNQHSFRFSINLILSRNTLPYMLAFFFFFPSEKILNLENIG